MINENINNLIEYSDDKKIEEELGVPISIGIIVAYLAYKAIKWLYKKFSSIEVSPQYLKYYTPLKNEFFGFLDVIDAHSDQFTMIRTSYTNNLKCQSTSGPNKEIQCVAAYIVDFPFYKVDIILSTLYDDGYDLLNLRSVEDVYKAKYTKTPELNKLIDSLRDGMVLFKSTFLELNARSINDFGVPIPYSYKDITDMMNKRIKQLSYDSTNWK